MIHTSDLIARDVQLDVLFSLLRKATQGKMQIALVRGEAGIGKTALLDGFWERAVAEVPRLVAAKSKCVGGVSEQAGSYLPFIEILEKIANSRKDQVDWDTIRRAVTEAAPEWLEVLPGGVVIAQILRGIGKLVGGQEEGESPDASRRMIQYANALRKASEVAPLLLAIDDLQWADSATLALISFLADHLDDCRIMFIVTYRSNEVEISREGKPHPVAQLVAYLKRYQQCVDVPLSNFTQDQLSVFLAARQHGFPEAFVTRLLQQSGGNPLFVIEFVKLLHDMHALKRVQGQWTLTQPLEDVVIPQTVQGVLKQRLDLIGDDLQRILKYASVQGERFISAVLSQLLEVRELDVLDKLRVLERTHELIRELETRHLIVKVNAEYQFVHILFQQVLYNDLGENHRRQLHLAIAQLLENLYQEQNAAEANASDLAYHYERGGDLEKAIPYYLQAARNSLSVLAIDDALRFADTVRNLALTLGQSEKSRQWYLEASLQLIEGNYRKAQYENVLTLCREMQEQCQPSNVELCASALYWEAQTLDTLGREYARKVELVRRALVILGEVPVDRRLQARLYVLLGTCTLTLPKAEALEATQKGLEIARQFDIPDVLVKALASMGIKRSVGGHLKESLPYRLEALAIAEKNQLRLERAFCCRRLTAVYRQLENSEEALRYSQMAVDAVRELGLPNEYVIALYTAAQSTRWILGDWSRAKELILEARAISERYRLSSDGDVVGEWFTITLGLGQWIEAEQAMSTYQDLVDAASPRRQGWHHNHQAQYAIARGKFEEAVEFRKLELVNRQTTMANEIDRIPVQANLGVSQIMAGHLDDGIRNLTDISSEFLEQRHDMALNRLFGLGLASLAQGRAEQAVTYLRELLATARSYQTIVPSARMWLAKALLACKQTADALQEAMTSYATYKKWGYYELGAAAFVVGRALTANGKPEEALPYLQEARAEWDRLELPHHLSEYDAFMKEYQSLTPPGREPARPAS